MNTKDQRISKVYARAFLQQAGGGAASALSTPFGKGLLELLEVLTAFCAPSSLRHAMAGLNIQQKISTVLCASPGFDPALRPVVKTLARYGRLCLLDVILDQLAVLDREKRGVPRVHLVVCPPETRGDDTALIKAAQKLVGPATPVTVRHDPRLLGGYTLEINGFLVDRSVRRYLNNLRLHCRESVDAYVRSERNPRPTLL
jgi:F0F1-type ATP synthase delta subunit